jgi:hypothetical protein
LSGSGSEAGAEKLRTEIEGFERFRNAHGWGIDFARMEAEGQR